MSKIAAEVSVPTRDSAVKVKLVDSLFEQIREITRVKRNEVGLIKLEGAYSYDLLGVDDEGIAIIGEVKALDQRPRSFEKLFSTLDSWRGGAADLLTLLIDAYNGRAPGLTGSTGYSVSSTWTWPDTSQTRVSRLDVFKYVYAKYTYSEKDGTVEVVVAVVPNVERNELIGMGIFLNQVDSEIEKVFEEGDWTEMGKLGPMLAIKIREEEREMHQKLRGWEKLEGLVDEVVALLEGE